MNNYMMYMGGEGIYTHTVAYEKDDECAVCGAGISMSIFREETLEDLLGEVANHIKVKGKILAPSISYGSVNLYMQGPLEEVTRHNLKKTLNQIMQGQEKGIFSVNDKKLSQTLRLNIRLTD